jgi:hypothetical protein
VRDGGIGSEAEAPLSIAIGSKDLRGLTWLRLLPPDKTGQLLVIWEASPSRDGRAHPQSDTYIWLIGFLLTLFEPNFNLHPLFLSSLKKFLERASAFFASAAQRSPITQG